MIQMVTIPVAEKSTRRPRSPKPHAKKAKPELIVVEEQEGRVAEPPATASRMLRPSYRPGGFGDPL